MIDILEGKKLIFTYNGHAFDIPYLNHKYKSNGFDYQIPLYYDFDILRVARANRTHLKLPDYKLKTIERFLGISREDAISGKESVEMYFDYLSSKDDDLKNKILLHNYEDILNIVDLFAIFDHCKTSSLYNELDYPIHITNADGNKHFNDTFYSKYALSKPTNHFILYLTNCSVKSHTLTCLLDSDNIFNLDFIYGKNNFKLNHQNGSLEINIPIIFFFIKDIEYGFIDIDTLYGHGSFNKLDPHAKMKLNVTTKKNINHVRVIDFLNNHICAIMEELIK